jgi:hypothetical protein
MSRGTELVVESFLVIDTRRISFNSYVTIHSEVALFLMSLCLIYSIYQSPSLSIARVSPPRSALILSGSAGPHQGLSCEPYNVPRQELLLSLSSLFSSSHPGRWSRNGPPACPHIASVTTAAHPQIDTCHCDLVVKRGTNWKYYSISQKSSILSISGANECLWFRLIRTISVEPQRRYVVLGPRPYSLKLATPWKIITIFSYT